MIPEKSELVVLTTALLCNARADAERILSEAAADIGREVAAAEHEADAILTTARDRGRGDATAWLTVERAKAQRVARSVELAAQREIYEEFKNKAASMTHETLLQQKTFQQATVEIVVELELNKLGGQIQELWLL